MREPTGAAPSRPPPPPAAMVRCARARCAFSYAAPPRSGGGGRGRARAASPRRGRCGGGRATAPRGCAHAIADERAGVRDCEDAAPRTPHVRRARGRGVCERARSRIGCARERARLALAPAHPARTRGARRARQSSRAWPRSGASVKRRAGSGLTLSWSPHAPRARTLTARTHARAPASARRSRLLRARLLVSPPSPPSRWRP